MTRRVPLRYFIRPGGVQKVARKRTQLGAVEVVLVVERHRVPARFRVHAPAHMRDGVRLFVAPRREVAAHQVSIEPAAFDACDEIVLDDQLNWFFEVAFEGQIDIALGHYQPPVHTALRRKRQAQPTRPVRNGAWPRGVTPAAAHLRANQVDR